MINISILGAGNVAQHLYTTFLQQESVKIIQCYNRKGITLHKNQDKNQITSNIKDLKKADIYILAVTDDAIDRISQELPFTGRLVVHTSGSVPMGMLDSKNNRGVFYPLQTFSKDKEVDFTKVPFCIEAENKTDMHTLKKLAFLLSNKIYEISSEQRNILHVSAVFVNNFTNHLYTIANQICEENTVPFEILHPLLLETAQKATQINPKEAQTGPAIRKDRTTIERHLGMLSNPEQKEIYKMLTKAIQSNYGKKL